MSTEPKVTAMLDLVAYQDNAVVSKTIMEQENGNVSLFAFDAGQGLSEHIAPYDALVDILEGEVEIMISGKAYILNSGEMVILPVNEPHSLKAITKFKMTLTMLRAHA